MPWITKAEGEKICVYKQGADGKETGDSLICYEGADAKSKATKYMRALYASTDHSSSVFADLEGESLDQYLNDVRESFYEKYNGMGGEYAYIKRIYPDYLIVEVGNDEIFKVPYTVNGKDISFSNRDSWVPQKYADMADDFLFVELEAKSSANELKAIDGLAAGTFTSMSGREVTFESADLPLWVKNTKEVIESTRTESGEIVGLPIDLNAHDHQGGAGWIVDLQLDSQRSIIRFIVKWTQAGVDLIAGNIRRFFSPSTDPSEKVVLGGSLTNWPATRDQSYKMLLRPVELSGYLKEIDMEKTVQELQAELDEAKGLLATANAKLAAVPAPLLQEGEELGELSEWLNSDGDNVEELSKRVQNLAAIQVKAQRRKDKVVEFASKIVGGTKERPFGLPIRSSKLIKLLLSLPEKQADEVQELVGLIYKNAIDFAEHGINGEDYAFKPKLPAELAQVASVWVESGKTIESWFESMKEFGIGTADEFDLSQFRKSEDKE